MLKSVNDKRFFADQKQGQLNAGHGQQKARLPLQTTQPLCSAWGLWWLFWIIPSLWASQVAKNCTANTVIVLKQLAFDRLSGGLCAGKHSNVLACAMIGSETLPKMKSFKCLSTICKLGGCADLRKLLRRTWKPDRSLTKWDQGHWFVLKMSLQSNKSSWQCLLL